ncbi:hypothetical protein AGMMS49928_15170 [Spirochaetia bacterium]|nr:hypothetical protein AGMMS49928_15170 [Spirochaetia bacterium]
MGSPASEPERDSDESPQHQVTVSAFYMGKYEVTQQEYRALMGANPSNFKGDNLPVEKVSWFEAVAYCNARSQAEWEYACRAGTTGPFSTGNNITTSQANYHGNKTTNVGSFSPNAWGLYDMHGNVWEWCWDWLGAYSGGSQTDPAGAASGSYRVFRGGGWNSSATGLRSAIRNMNTPSARASNYGFRVVRP